VQIATQLTMLNGAPNSSIVTHLDTGVCNKSINYQPYT